MNRLLRPLSTGLVLTLLLASCQTPSPPAADNSPLPTVTAGVADSDTTDSVAIVRDMEPTSLPIRDEIREGGSGEYWATPATSVNSSSSPEQGGITLNFQNTDLREFIKATVGEVLGKNFMIDPGVTGKVTIDTVNPLARESLFSVIEEVLALNNAAIYPTEDMYRIVPKNQVLKGNLSPLSPDTPAIQGYGIHIIPLQYIAAGEMQKILEPLMAEGSYLRTDKKRNLLIVSGTANELAQVRETVGTFDVDWLRGVSVGLFAMEHASPRTLQRELEAIMAAAEANESKEVLGGIVRLVPVERLNSLLVISSTPAGLREMEIWISRLDKPGDQAGRQFFVYNVQNGRATDLADMLGHIIGSTVAVHEAQPRTEPTISALQDPLVGSAIAPLQDSPMQSRSAAPMAQASTGSASEGGLAGLESVRVIADDQRNALVVLATLQQFKLVEQALLALDTVPLQVLIEASIIEVTLRDDLNYGVEWFFKNTVNLNGDKAGRGTLDLGDAGIAALSPSFSYTVIDNANQVRLALNALSEQSEVNVLSSPSLMVLDNQTAIINVGDEIPVPTRQAVSVIDPDAPTVNEIQFRQTGVTLTVTPRVNKSGLVTMEIKQEVSNAVSTTSSEIEAPTIQQRQIQSIVAINSGETIVLGGLIQNSETQSKGGIPILHKIPLVGNLFGQTRDESRRTELLVLLTPKVVQSREDARGATEELKRKLSKLKTDKSS